MVIYGYSNKILAMLFTSFEELILLDADVVPLVPPEEFFNSKQYKNQALISSKIVH